MAEVVVRGKLDLKALATAQILAIEADSGSGIHTVATTLIDRLVGQEGSDASMAAVTAAKDQIIADRQRPQI